MTGRQDIIGDLARLKVRFLSSDDGVVLDEMEVLAGAAVRLGMSYAIVTKASGVPRERIDVVMPAKPTTVERCSEDYERHPSGVFSRREGQ